MSKVLAELIPNLVEHPVGNVKISQVSIVQEACSSGRVNWCSSSSMWALKSPNKRSYAGWSRFLQYRIVKFFIAVSSSQGVWSSTDEALESGDWGVISMSVR
ncbi:hypothetical protein TNCV_4682731 [Trichonephila clavipes]|nr:hypothetical protein TNCV_4682731 [Trichonephila clavipes]